MRPGIRRLFRLGDARADVDEEIAVHLEHRIDMLVREGMSPADARAEALRRFAASDAALRALHATARERNSRLRHREAWEAIRHELRYALRRLLREPLVTGFMLLALALGIGANVTAFTLIDRIMVRGPSHLTAPDELSRLYRRTDRPPVGIQTSAWIPWPTIAMLREQLRGVQGMAAYRITEERIGRGVASRPEQIGAVDGGFFGLLGVQPVIGRFFAPGEDATRDGRLAVIGEATWRNDFAGDPGVLGRTIVIADRPHTIVGVAPAGFTGVGLERIDAWTLIDGTFAKMNNWNVVVRRAPGTSTEALGAAADVSHQRNLAASPEWARQATLLAAPLGFDHAARPTTESVLARWLAAISLIVLLIASANVTNLQLARLMRRRQELGIRVALGAGRARVVRLILLEGILLAVAAGVVSLAVAAVTGPLVRRTLFARAGWEAATTDPRAWAIVVAITLLTALVIGGLPALQAGNPRLAASLGRGDRVSGGRAGIRHALTVTQAALSVVLLVGAGLFVRSLAAVRAVDLGLDIDRVLVAEVSVPRAGTFEAQALAERRRYRDLLPVAQRQPGVERAALTVGLPFQGSFQVGLWLEGGDSVPTSRDDGPYITAVSSEYFATVGTPLVRGRVFGAEEREGSAPVVIVGETMAKRLWPDRDPLTACLVLFERGGPCAPVVGVVGDIHRNGLHEESSLQYYIPIGHERNFSGTSMVIRPRHGASLSWPALGRALTAADPGTMSVDLRMLSSALDGQMRPLRLGLITFGLSATLALVVAALGLYSVMAYTVSWRTREIGVRMALGATESQVARLVVSGSMLLAGAGVGIGLLLAFLARRAIEPQLFGVSGADPLVFGGVAGTILLVALLAGWIPARRAARIRPVEALRG